MLLHESPSLRMYILETQDKVMHIAMTRSGQVVLAGGDRQKRMQRGRIIQE